MKITIDVDKLLEQRKITPAEHEKLISLGRRQSWRHAWAVLGVMSCLALFVGACGLLPDDAIRALADLLVALYKTFGRLTSHTIVFALLLGAGIILRSGFLTGLSCFVVLGFLGGTAAYSHASYLVAIQEPAVTTLVFSVLAATGLAISYRVKPDYERLAIIFARTCLILVNMALWIGSLWGSNSPLGEIPGGVFSVVWATGLLSILLWGGFSGRMFVVNSAVWFGAIHFYTQWFEYFGAKPVPLFIGGLIGVALTVIVWQFNRYLRTRDKGA